MSIAERVRYANRRLFQPPATEAKPTLWTFLRHKATKDVLVAVAKPHHTLVHGEHAWTQQFPGAMLASTPSLQCLQMAERDLVVPLVV